MGFDKDLHRSATDELRRRAEEKLHANGAETGIPPTDDEKHRLLQELQVHQIELEMQNAELRQVRDEMETALEKYTNLYDFAPVGYFTLDRDGTIRAANLTGSGLLGIERSRLIGRRFGQFVAAEARPLFAEFLGKVFASRAKEACELALLKAEHLSLVAQIEAVAIESRQECRLAVIDMSERKRLEEKLEILYADLAARAAELEAANSELEAFNYSVSHDLRRPLTVINGYCQVIQELSGDKLDEPSKGYLQEIYEGTLRMNRLIDTLLNFSRITRVGMHHEEVDLSRMAHEVTAELRLSEPKRRVTFHVADGVKADGDANLLRVVLDNLLGNAWKYTGTRKEGIIEFGTLEVDGKPAYSVRDNGAGFDMAHSDKLFTSFHRLPGAEECRGFGIGLATVERIIRRHGGRVWAESDPGQGATFYFTLSGSRTM
jgi:PAS domain S-box-containing protein